MRRALVTAVAVAVVTTISPFSPIADAAPKRFAAWAPATAAAIRPGAMAFTPAGGCTTNFVYTDLSNNVYMGLAAHCFTKGGMSDLDGCTTPSFPVGTKLEIDGASQPATLVYSSWVAMKAAGQKGAACLGNDFSVVRLDAADKGKVNPTVPVWGGPTGVGGATGIGEQVHAYGNSELRGGFQPLRPQPGVSFGMTNGGWTHKVGNLSIPGDSGSGLLDRSGRAIGVLSYISFSTAVPPANQNYADLSKVLTYAKDHTPSLSSLKLTTGGAGSLVELVTAP